MPNIYFHALFTKYHTNIYVKRLKMDTLKPKVAFGGGYSIVFSHPINKIYRCQDSYDFSSAEIAMLLPPTQSMEFCKSARFQIEITAAYRLRNPQSSDYYRCVEDYFETFVSIYDEHFSRQYGFWRPYLEKVFHRKRYWRGFLFIILIMLRLFIIAGIAAAGALESLIKFKLKVERLTSIRFQILPPSIPYKKDTIIKSFFYTSYAAGFFL